MSGHTPGPWAWFGSTRTNMYLATTHSGRRFVMGFKRKGLHGAEPTFQIDSIMVPASELAIYQVDPDARTGKEPSVYRHDITGFRSADARLIAAAPELLDGCNALLGLLQLVCDRDDLSPSLRDVLTTNHRINEARAALAKAGVA